MENLFWKILSKVQISSISTHWLFDSDMLLLVQFNCLINTHTEYYLLSCVPTNRLVKRQLIQQICMNEHTKSKLCLAVQRRQLDPAILTERTSNTKKFEFTEYRFYPLIRANLRIWKFQSLSNFRISCLNANNYKTLRTSQDSRWLSMKYSYASTVWYVILAVIAKLIFRLNNWQLEAGPLKLAEITAGFTTC